MKPTQRRQVVQALRDAANSLAQQRLVASAPPDWAVEVAFDGQRSSLIEAFQWLPGPRRIAIGSLNLDWTGPAAVVSDIRVRGHMARKGVATSMYEAAAKLAETRGLPLRSDISRYPGADGFWKKQVSKGRATAVPVGPNKFGLDPEKTKYYLLKYPPPPSLSASAVLARKDARQQNFWSKVGFRTLRYDDGTYWSPPMVLTLRHQGTVQAPKLSAKSFSEKDIPRDFRLMFFLPNEKVPTLGTQLARRQLEGVTGITDSGQVLMLRMLGANRNAMLVMPGEQTAKLNKLSRIMYENPEYWMSKDMAALIRVYGGSTNREAAINRIFQAADKAPGSRDFMRTVSSLDLYPSAFPATPVNTVKDLAKQWFEVAKPLLLKKLAANSLKPTLNPADWDEWARDRYSPLLDLKAYEKAITDGLKVIAKTFVWEGEWLLKDKTLRIPQGSRLFLTKPKSVHDQARFKAQQAMIAEHGLDKIYKIAWVDGEKLQQTAMKYGMTAADKLVKRRLAAKTSAKAPTGLEGIIPEGEPTTLYHGTTKTFSRFDSTKSRDELVNAYYGPGIFLTPDKRVAWAYARANRNIGFEPELIDDLKLVNRKAAAFLREIYTRGHDAWDLIDIDRLGVEAGQPYIDAVSELTGGADANTLADVCEWIIGTKLKRGRTNDGPVMLFDESTGMPDYVYDYLDELGLDSKKYRPKVYTVTATAHNVLITKSKAEARSARRKGFDCVVFYGADLVHGVPEVAMFNSNNVKIKNVEVD